MVRNIYPEPICIDHIEQVIYNNSAPQVEHLLHNDLLLDVLQVYGIRMLVRRFFYAIKEGGEYYVSFRPTANRAIGSANQEWEQKLCLAYLFRTDARMTKK